MQVPNYSLVQLLRDMAPFNLSYMKPRTTDNLWVFWSQEGEGGDLDPVTETLTNNNWGNVQEYLKSALCNTEYAESVNVLIQFWAPTTSTIGGHCVLTTLNQPFGLYKIERGLSEYRKHCTTLEFYAFQDEKEEENENEFGSLMGESSGIMMKTNICCSISQMWHNEIYVSAPLQTFQPVLF